MSHQNQDTVVKLAENFKRYERHLAYFLCTDTPDPTIAIDDRDLELPISFRLAQIQGDKYALGTFVNKHRAEYHKYASRLAAEPENGLHAFYTARHCFAIRNGQRALGQPAEQLLPWPELLQRLFTQMHHPDLQRCLEEDIALAPSRYDVLTSDTDGISLLDKNEIYEGRQSGPVTSPTVTPPLRNHQNANTAQQHSFDPIHMDVASTSNMSAAINQSRSDSVTQRISLDDRSMKNILTPIVGDKPYAETHCFENPFIQRISRSMLLSSVSYVIIRKEMGVERVYWKDVDQDGMSTLRINMLAFLTKEFMLRGEQGQNLCMTFTIGHITLKTVNFL
jgi:hypothetical protein